MKRIVTTGALLLGSLVTFNTLAQQQQSPEEAAQAAVDNRQAVFHLLSWSNGPLGQMARGGEFDQEAAVKGTERIIVLAEMIPELFALDTSSYDLETRAADTIWQNKADFDMLAMDLKTGAEAAIGILNDQGADGVRAAVQQIGPKCGACHDRFRLD